MNNDETTKQHINSHTGRRQFLSLSLFAGSGLLLPAENKGQAPKVGRGVNQNEEILSIVEDITAADTLALYTNLLDEVRRLVLRTDAEKIFSSKLLATERLDRITAQARMLQTKYPQSSAILTDGNKQEIHNLISRVIEEGENVRLVLIQMRLEPLEEIKRLDREFDTIREFLITAANSIKGLKGQKPRLRSSASIKADLWKAQKNIKSAMWKITKYDSVSINELSRVLETEYQTKLVTPLELNELLQTVHDYLGKTSLSNTGKPDASEVHFRQAKFTNSMMIEPVLQNGITGVLRAKLDPASWLQIAVGYGVSFPILMRVGDKENRIKLLKDALRLVPPGLRNPLLSDLAISLANL